MYGSSLMFEVNEGSRSPFVCERPLPYGQPWIVPFLLPFSETLSRGEGYNRGVLENKIQRDHCRRLIARIVNRRTWRDTGWRRGSGEGGGAVRGGSENLNGGARQIAGDAPPTQPLQVTSGITVVGMMDPADQPSDSVLINVPATQGHAGPSM